MPVRNGAPFLDAALASLAAQTFGDFEIVAVDNGSTDDTPAILAAWAAREPRLRAVSIGRARLAEALNHAAALARAPLLARLDSDDIAFAQRLEVQVRTMGERPGLGLLGSAAALIDAAGQRIGALRLPLEHEEIVRYQRTSSALVASSTMMRAEVFRRAGGYRKGLNVSDDFDLWARAGEICRIANLDDALVGYRVHGASVTGRTQVRMALASACVVAAAEARLRDLPEPFIGGVPGLRRALPLLGLTRRRAKRMVRLRCLANGVMRGLVGSPAPPALKRLALRLVRSAPAKILYRRWLARAHGSRAGAIAVAGPQGR
jgi:glycosyltransferase involved in cell wall biosynthesis